jgi:uncharacterized OsmC-like protein
MNSPAEIKDALERNAKAVSLRHSVGQGTAKTVATLTGGLSCVVTEGAHRIAVDMTEKYGGTNNGPNPGVLGRASLASCLVIGIAMWAARMDVPLEALEVEVQADYDVRGELGVSLDVHPGYLAMRYAIRVRTTAPEARVRTVLDAAIQCSSYIDNFSRSVPLTGDIRIEAV